jgi:hypothetical protein
VLPNLRSGIVASATEPDAEGLELGDGGAELHATPNRATATTAVARRTFMLSSCDEGYVTGPIRSF